MYGIIEGARLNDNEPDLFVWFVERLVLIQHCANSRDKEELTSTAETTRPQIKVCEIGDEYVKV
jgi:hypothetical protein